MFDTMNVARKIREARISQNMTQMNLADAMEVSYQAVSNWERGHSMPDISKLEQLCQILQLGMDELLSSDSARTLERIIHKEEDSTSDTAPVPLQEIQTVAPLIPPAQMEQLVDETLEQLDLEHLNVSAITALAPFLDTEYLDNIVQRAQTSELSEFAGLAPFLSSKTLDHLVLSRNPKADLPGLSALAPFLSAPTLEQLAIQLTKDYSIAGVTCLAPFLSKEALDKLVAQIDCSDNITLIVALAPFLSKDTLNQVVQKLLAADRLIAVSGLAPFLSSETLDKTVMNADPETDMPGVTALAPFLSKATLNNFMEKALESGHVRLSGLYPFLSGSSLKKLAEHLMTAENLTELQSIKPFL